MKKGRSEGLNNLSKVTWLVSKRAGELTAEVCLTSGSACLRSENSFVPTVYHFLLLYCLSLFGQTYWMCQCLPERHFPWPPTSAFSWFWVTSISSCSPNIAFLPGLVIDLLIFSCKFLKQQQQNNLELVLVIDNQISSPDFSSDL